MHCDSPRIKTDSLEEEIIICEQLSVVTIEWQTHEMASFCKKKKVLFHQDNAPVH